MVSEVVGSIIVTLGLIGLGLLLSIPVTSSATGAAVANWLGHCTARASTASNPEALRESNLRSSFYLIGYCSTPSLASDECAALLSLLKANKKFTIGSMVKTVSIEDPTFPGTGVQLHAVNATAATHLWFGCHDGRAVQLTDLNAAAAARTDGSSGSSSSVGCGSSRPWYACDQLDHHEKTNRLMGQLATAVQQQGAACIAGQLQNMHPAAAAAAAGSQGEASLSKQEMACKTPQPSILDDITSALGWSVLVLLIAVLVTGAIIAVYEEIQKGIAASKAKKHPQAGKPCQQAAALAAIKAGPVVGQNKGSGQGIPAPVISDTQGAICDNKPSGQQASASEVITSTGKSTAAGSNGTYDASTLDGINSESTDIASDVVDETDIAVPENAGSKAPPPPAAAAAAGPAGSSGKGSIKTGSSATGINGGNTDDGGDDWQQVGVEEQQE